jgi:accessory gene regulator B
MISKITDLVLNNLSVNNKINPDNREIYAYALENFISDIITWFVFSLAAILLKLPDKMIIFVAFYAPIRKFAGGYHAKTRVGCLLLSLFSTLIMIYTSLMISRLTIWYIGAILCMVLSIILVFTYAPIDHHNRRLSLEKKYLNKRISRYIIMSECVLVIIGMLFFHQWKEYILVASMALLLEGVVLIPYKLNTEDTKHEKSKFISNKDV